MYMASQVALIVKNPPAKAEDIRERGLIPGSGRSSGGGHGNPLQYSCLENPMNLVRYSLQSCKELDTTDLLTHKDNFLNHSVQDFHRVQSDISPRTRTKSSAFTIKHFKIITKMNFHITLNSSVQKFFKKIIHLFIFVLFFTMTFQDNQKQRSLFGLQFWQALSWL